MNVRFLLVVFSVLLVSCGSGTDSNEQTNSDDPNPPPISQQPESLLLPEEAARLLNQATFGATSSEIERLTLMTRTEWLDGQISEPPSFHVPLIAPFAEQEDFWRNYRIAAWWQHALYAPDQLRQRVAFALSEIIVISEYNGVLIDDPVAVGRYYDLLLEHAFGNYRELLEAVTLSPAMGVYLSMLGNEKPDQERNIRPDENYAREVMQLFSLGLVELNNDGSVKLDEDQQPIATYNQDVIKGFAHVFTGWHFNGTTEQTWYWWWDNLDLMEPMTVVAEYHDSGEKQLFSGTVLPANQTPEQDLSQALDAIFNHNNVPPFISKQLIQKLVTSNPSAQYIERVASVFIDNGYGERGDLAAVIRAILTDDEALNGHQNMPNSFGKVREPLIRAAHLWRAFNFTTENEIIDLGWPEYFFLQAPLASPSVFNFYRPDYSPASLRAETGLLAPELQIATDSAVTNTNNFFAWYGLWRSFSGEFNQFDEDERLGQFIDLSPWVELAEQSSDTLVAELDLVITNGTLSDEAKALLSQEYDELQWMETHEKVANMIFLLMVSPQYVVQR